MKQTMNRTLGRPVIGLDTAEDLGEIKSFVVDQRVDRIERLHIAGRRSHSLFAEWSDLESFGQDAVMVTAANAPSESDDDRDIDVARGNIDILGARVLDTFGFEHGVVDDVAFDDADGSIVDIVTSTGITAERDDITGLGSYALVIHG